MSNEQQVTLDAILREGGLDLRNDAQTLRAAFNELMQYVPVADDVEQRPTTIGGVDAVEVTIRGADSSDVVLYFHGGVYVIGSAAASVPLVSELARRADVKAITVEYRLAPEHPFPAAVEDAPRHTKDSSNRASTLRTSLLPVSQPELGSRWRRSSSCETRAYRFRAVRF